MKFKVLLLICSALAITACGGGDGSGGDVDDSTDTNSSIPNNTIPQIVDEEVIADYEDYFDLEGSPIVHNKWYPDYYGLVYNYQLEEFDNNLIIKTKESGTTELYQRSQSVDLSNYTEVVEALDDQWVACINYKEASTNSNGDIENVYFSRKFRRSFTPYQSVVFVEFQVYSGLDCDRRKAIGSGSYSTLVFSTETVDNAMEITIGYEYGHNEDEATEYTHKVLMAKDGNSFIMFEGDKTYTLYNRIP